MCHYQFWYPCLFSATAKKFDSALDYCVIQVDKTAGDITDYTRFPRSILNSKTQWRTIDYHDWTSGFWPGIEWYLYEYTKNINQSKEKNNAFLLHSTGHKPAGGEIDASIIYADYYYLEALLRAEKLNQGKSIYQSF